MKSNAKFHSISEIVATTYCEQQIVFDRQYGPARSKDVQRKATSGRKEHKHFENEGKAKQAFDRRCFIASAIYGANASETVHLRQWRDTVLMPTPLGRLLVQAYYTISPPLVPLLLQHNRLRAIVQAALNVFLSAVKRPK